MPTIYKQERKYLLMDYYTKKLKDWYEQIAERYDSWGTRDGEFSVAPISEEVIQFNKLLDKVKLSDGKILDVATGTGTYLIEVLKRGGVGYGIDISKNMISVLKKKIKNSHLESRINVKIGNAAEITFKERFDLILCIGLFDYYDFDEVKVFLQNMKKVAKKDCQFIVDFPNKNKKETYTFQEKERSVGHEVFIHKPEEILSFLKKQVFNILAQQEAGIETQFLLKLK